MKHLFHLFYLVLFTSASFIFSACGDKKTDATPQTGSVTGQIQPVNSITTVTATSSSNQAFTATPSATGTYTIASLTAGTYTLSFTPATGYAAPATQSVTVTAGGTTTATTVTATTSSSASGTFTVGGVVTTSSLVLASYQFNNLSITMASTTGRSVVMNIDGFTSSTGSYSLASQTNASQLIYSEQVGTNAQQWTTAAFLSNNLGTGTAVITSIGSNPRRVSGTFTANAYPATSASTGTRAITGSFTNVPY